MMRPALAALAMLGTVSAAHADDRATCNNGSGDVAIAACNRAIESGAFSGIDLGKLFTSRGVELKRKGEIDAAIADYTRAIALNSADLFAFNNRANTRRDKGDVEGAVADYGEAIRLDPDYTAAYINRGLVNERRGALDLARVDFEAALVTSDTKYPNSRGGKQIARERLRILTARP